ncbi:MAG TPA: cytidine deaminase [Terracidiphilus sp.]|nr:cytidine deaminase [Terracidiphilus sp.]
MKQLMTQAEEVAHHAHASYSGFAVGAALELDNGEIVTGTNVENMSYGLTICAERSALVRAVAMFGNGIRVKAAAITNLNGEDSPPCGACRQVLAEFMEREASLAFPWEGKVTVVPFSAVLPYPFALKGKK